MQTSTMHVVQISGTLRQLELTSNPISHSKSGAHCWRKQYQKAVITCVSIGAVTALYKLRPAFATQSICGVSQVSGKTNSPCCKQAAAQTRYSIYIRGTTHKILLVNPKYRQRCAGLSHNWFFTKPWSGRHCPCLRSMTGCCCW